MSFAEHINKWHLRQMRWCTIGQIHNKSLVIIGKSNVCTAARRHSSINFLRKSLLALAVLSAISMHYARKDRLCGTQMDQNISLCDLFCWRYAHVRNIPNWSMNCSYDFNIEFLITEIPYELLYLITSHDMYDICYSNGNLN